MKKYQYCGSCGAGAVPGTQDTSHSPTRLRHRQTYSYRTVSKLAFKSLPNKNLLFGKIILIPSSKCNILTAR